MANVLIAYRTTHGHTLNVSERIRDTLKDGGHCVQLIDVRKMPPGLDVSAFDGVLVGASIHRGKFDRQPIEFVKSNLGKIQKKPSAFFVVCLTAADDTDKQRAIVQDYVRDFLTQTGWTPSLTRPCAGALAYTKYNFLIRFIMKKISARQQGETDTSRDHVYTDWDAIRVFATEFAALLLDGNQDAER